MSSIKKSPKTAILIEKLEAGFEEFETLLHFNEDVFFNIYSEPSRKNSIKALKNFQKTSQKNILKLIAHFINLKQFQPVHKSSTNLWNPTDIMSVLQKFEKSSNTNDLSTLESMMDNLKTKIDMYVEKNIQNTIKLVIDDSPEYTAYPHWDDI